MSIAKQTVIAAAMVLLAGAAAEATAAPVTYTETGTGSGTLGGNSFSNATVTMTFTGDTTGVTDIGSLFSFFTLTPLTAGLTISGLGSATFTETGLFVFDNQIRTQPAGGFAGFGDSVTTILATQAKDFFTYDLTTDIGPDTGSSTINTGVSFTTDQGALRFTEFGDATFTATVGVPEPATLAAFGIGLIGLGALRRRRAA